MYHAGEIECFDAGHIVCFCVVGILVFVVPYAMLRYMKYLRKKPVERHYWEILAPLLLNYRDECWFQSVINIFRRGILICLPLVPITDLGGRAALISFSMGLLLSTHCYLMPYKFTVNNHMETYVLILAFWISVLNVVDNRPDVFAWFVAIMALSPFVPAAILCHDFVCWKAEAIAEKLPIEFFDTSQEGKDETGANSAAARSSEIAKQTSIGSVASQSDAADGMFRVEP